MTRWSAGQSFSDYGWTDLSPSIDVLADFGLDGKISSFLAKKFKAHTSDSAMHPHGRLSYGGVKATTDISRKIAKTDVSNLDPAR